MFHCLCTEHYQEEKRVRGDLGESTVDVELTIADVLTKLGRTDEANTMLMEMN